jgi:acyl-coenzyme A thioesterase PaaI-like protein
MSDAPRGVSDADEPYDRCYGCGQGNASGLRLRFEHRDGSAECVYTAPEHLAGAPGVIHGGAQATMLDEVMGHAIHYGDVDPDLDVVTIEFTLRYRRPAPIGKPLTLRGRLVRSEGRDFLVAGEIVAPGGEVLTSAESRWRRITRRGRA